MFFKVKLSLIVDVVLPSVIALQQSRPRQPQQALAQPQNRLPSCTVQCEHCYISDRFIFTYIYMIDR